MNNKAFALTLEAALALLAVSAIAVLPTQSDSTGLFELLLLQKQNDLLKVWLQQSELEESELVSDYNFVFPSHNGTIVFGEKAIEIKNSNSKARSRVSTKAFFLSGNNELIELGIAVQN